MEIKGRHYERLNAGTTDNSTKNTSLFDFYSFFLETSVKIIQYMDGFKLSLWSIAIHNTHIFVYVCNLIY